MALRLNFTEVKRSLSRLAELDQAKVKQRAGVAGGNVLIRTAKPKAPWVTGTLRRSGTVEALPDGARAGFGTEYARRVHYGFIGQDSLGRNYNQAAQPYLEDALQESQGEVLAEMGDVAKQEITKRLK